MYYHWQNPICDRVPEEAGNKQPQAYETHNFVKKSITGAVKWECSNPDDALREYGLAADE